MSGRSYECCRCRVSKPETEFGVGRDRSRGRRYACKACEGIAAAARRARDPEASREAVRQSRERNYARAAVDACRKRAHKKGLAFDLDQYQLEIKQRLEDGHCELTGLPFRIGRGHHWASPAIDRIEPAKGYVYSNIRIILHGLNNALGFWGEDVLYLMVDAMRAKK